MNSEKDKIRIDTTENSEEEIKKESNFSNLKKFLSLVVFIYCCLIPILFGILSSIWEILIKIFFKKSNFLNPENALSELLLEIEKEEEECANSLRIPYDYEQELCNKWKDKIGDFKKSFSEKVEKIGGFCENNDLGSLLEKLVETDKQISKKEQRKLKKKILQELKIFWEESYVPEKQNLKYNTTTKEWEAEEFGNFELLWNKPKFFFLTNPINIISEKIISLTNLRKENNYCIYFHVDVVIKIFIINFIIKKILDFFSEKFFDKKTSPFLFFLVKPMIWIFFVRIASKDILLDKLPSFWQKRKNWEMHLIFTIYEFFFFLVAEFLKSKNSKRYSNLLPAVLMNILTIITREAILRIIGVVRGKKEMISFFFMYRLIPEEIINPEGNNFSDFNLETKNEKIEIDYS